MPFFTNGMKITIFGLAGTGTSTVGKTLAERLGYKFLSAGDIFRKKASELGLTLAEVHNLAVDDPSIDKECDTEIKKFGEHNDNLVVESRLAWHFIPDSVKIKLHTDFDTRVSRVAERDWLLFKLAKQHITDMEQADATRYAKFYGLHDIEKDDHFDLVIDASTLTHPQIANQISAFIKSREG